MKNLNNMGNILGGIFGDIVTNVSNVWNGVCKDVKNGYDAATTVHFSDKEVWMQVVVQKAELKGSVIFIVAKDVKTSKTVVMTLSTAGQYKDSQLKKLGALLAFMGQCPMETHQLAVQAINEAPEKRLLVLLKGWKSDPTLANVVRVQAHDHKAEPKVTEPQKAEPVTKPKAKGKPKGTGNAKGKAPVQELDESF